MPATNSAIIREYYTRNTDTRQEFWDCIFGSGFDSFGSWWSAGDWDDEDPSAPVMLEVTDPDDPMGMPIQFHLTFDDVLNAFIKFWEEWAPLKRAYPTLTLSSDGLDLDIDAVYADVVLQQACFNEVIYG